MKKKRGAREFVDYDYLDQLSPEEKEWLTNFTRAEYFNDHKALAKIAKPTKKQKTRLTQMDNARRRDLATIGTRKSGGLVDRSDNTTLEGKVDLQDKVSSTSTYRMRQLTNKKKKR